MTVRVIFFIVPFFSQNTLTNGLSEAQLGSPEDRSPETEEKKGADAEESVGQKPVESHSVEEVFFFCFLLNFSGLR